MNKNVLTGAAGRLGSFLREPLPRQCKNMLSRDIVDNLTDLYENESFVKVELADYDQIDGCRLELAHAGLPRELVQVLTRWFAVSATLVNMQKKTRLSLALQVINLVNVQLTRTV